MTLSNWIELILLPCVITGGILFVRHVRRKLYNKDGFGGVITERGRPPRRIKLDSQEEYERLLKIRERKESGK